MDDNRKKFDGLLARRDSLRESVQRVQGRLDSAKADLAKVEEECRKRKIDPAQLDTAIEQLQTRYDATAAELDKKLKEAETQIAPFLTEE